ncbi:MAG: TetR/AcrR family transcriptional regulator [Bacteroidota bacterium]|nr:MAG: TetR/AcrR family transcriptional regulator [Bacteroidota bacterium]
MVNFSETEEKILLAARTVFIRKGLSGARMQEIADEAGINKALLHYYFRSKEKLFERIFEEVLKNLATGISEVLSSDIPILEKLDSFIDKYSEALSANPYLPVFVLNEMSQNPSRIKAFFEKGVLPAMINFFAQIQREVGEGKINPINPAHLLLNIMGMLVLPYAVSPMIAPVLKENMGISYTDILAERKKVISAFVLAALKK